jgi:hypothetical protein
MLVNYDVNRCTTLGHGQILTHHPTEIILKGMKTILALSGWKPTNLTSVFSLRTTQPHGTMLTDYADVRLISTHPHKFQNFVVPFCPHTSTATRPNENVYNNLKNPPVQKLPCLIIQFQFN